MLNELTLACKAIQQAGISPYEWDEQFVVLPKVTRIAPCFAIEVDEHGCPVDVRKLPDGAERFLHRWGCANAGKFFPGFNAIPLIYISKDEWNSARKTGSVRDIVSRFDFLSDARSVYEKCIGQQGKEFLKRIGDGVLLPCVRKLIDAVESFQCETFCNDLRNLIVTKINEGHNDFEILLVSHLENVKERSTKKISVFIETVGNDGGRLATEEVMRFLNDRLMATRNTKIEAEIGNDAFGIEIEGLDVVESPIPQVDGVPKLGKVLLRSMPGSRVGDGSPCKDRYNLSGGYSYPLSKVSQSNARNALKWLCSLERQGLTWESLGPSALVFAYAKNFERAPLSRMFSHVTAEKVVSDESSFSACAKDALSMLRGHKSEEIGHDIVMFALKKADASSARRKLVYYRDFTVDHLQRSVESWEKGTCNLPDILVRVWDAQEKGKSTCYELCAPYPISLTSISNLRWKCSSNNEFKSFPILDPKKSVLPYEESYEVFFDDTHRSMDLSRGFLSKIISNASCILTKASSRPFKEKSKEQELYFVTTALPLIGILLYKLSIRKEQYMNETPYMLGKFLNLADGLHRLWCECVRDKDGKVKTLPPVLIGNGFYSSVSQSPIRGIATLGERLRVYLAWAKTYQGEKTGLAHWYLKELSSVCDTVHLKGIPMRLSDADKAQMLLGYLASLKSTDDGSKEDDVTISE